MKPSKTETFIHDGKTVMIKSDNIWVAVYVDGVLIRAVSPLEARQQFAISLL